MTIQRVAVGLLVLGVMVGPFARSLDAAVVCARRRADGTFNTALKIREACKPTEVRIGVLTIDPLVLGVQAPSTTTTTGAASTSTSPGSTVTTTTFPGTPVCGNGIVEGAEACDCAGTIEQCQPFPTNSGPFDWNACPTTADGRFQYCASDCSACLPAPVCGDGKFDPGDVCDYATGFNGDQCPSGTRCTLTDPCRCQ
jgi:hypothetical protein